MDLIFVTAAFRLKNLTAIADSIREAMRNYPELKYSWHICVDQYNAKGDLYKLCNYLSTYNIPHLIIKSGKPNQPNYGGDIMGDGIYCIDETYNNPWIYILDDDNIVHPMIPEIIHRIKNNFLKIESKEIIWTTCTWFTGKMVETYKGLAFQPCPDLERGGTILSQFTYADPSQVLMRKSIYDKYGPMPGGFRYDFDWLLPLMRTELQNDNVVVYSDIDGFCKDKFHTWHNGLRTVDDLESSTEALNHDDIVYPYFVVNSNNLNRDSRAYPVSRELAKKIINLIREDYFDKL